MGHCICAPCNKDWAVRVVFAGEEVYSSLAKVFPNFLNRELVKHPFLWRDVPRQHACSLVQFAQHMHCLQRVQIVLCPHKRVVHQHAESLWDETALVFYVWYHRRACLSVLAHGVPVCPVGWIDRPDILLAFLSSWCAGSIPPRPIDRRSVCRCTALPNPCWKRLSWQPSFSAPCLESRLALARGGSSNGSGLLDHLFLGYHCKQSSAALINSNDTVFPWLSL